MIPAVLLTDVTGTTIYMGECLSHPDIAKSSSIWRISRLTQPTSGATILYADGVTTFTKQWTERINYNYSAA